MRLASLLLSLLLLTQLAECRSFEERQLEAAMSQICPLSFHGACEYEGQIMFCPDTASPEFWRTANSVAPTAETHNKLGVKFPCKDHTDKDGNAIYTNTSS